MRTILAPGIEIKEIDKSGYSPAMTGTGCLVPGFTDRGEPYLPMEFTSRAAWISYYGDPKNEAERYAYAAACEVLNQGGRLFFSRLPYDNTAFEKVVGFKYKLSDHKQISADWADTEKTVPKRTKEEYAKGEVPKWNATPFWEVQAADKSVQDIVAIEPAQAACLYDLSAIDEYRTDENKVAADTFMIANIAFNTYDKVPEDTRKDSRREMIGIMPVITTAANGMLAQSLINVGNESVIGYETIGTINTIDFAKQFPELTAYAHLSANTVLKEDMAQLINTRDWYSYISSVTEPVPTMYKDAEFKNKGALTSFTDKLSAEDWVNNNAGGSISAVTTPWGLSCEKFDFVKQWHVEGKFNAGVSDEDKLSAQATLDATNAKLFSKKYESKTDADNRAADTVSKWFGKIDVVLAGGTSKLSAIATPCSVQEKDWQPKNEEYLTETARDTKYAEYVADTENYKNVAKTVNGATTYNCGWVRSDEKKIDLEIADSRYGWHNPDGDDSLPKTLSRDANTFFPTIGFDGEKFDRDNLKKIGVVVYKMFLDPSEGNKINFEAVEAYAGSLCKTDKDPNTGVTTFIDTIINSQSKYINFFSNCFAKPSEKKYYAETLDMLVVQPCAAHGSKVIAPDTKEIKDTVCPSMGFFSEMTKKDISISKSIYDGLNKVFEKNQDILERQIDIVPDAGVANIASYLKAIYGDKGQYDLAVTDDLGNSLLGMWKCDSNNLAVKTWKTVEQKFDNFCKNIRKDCMFIADGPRPLVLAGQKKIIRPSKPANTIDVNIIPNIKWVTGLNTSYGAMYVDWFEQADDYSGDFFWCPPSIKAMGVYINTDVNYNYWDAPAGLNRGVIAATDVAFSPTIKQAGCFYEKNLNYAIQYPNDGIVLEGQKTLQAKPSAFDRVNVRRLFLRLERQSFIVSRYFVYEGNTAYLRQRLIDALDPYFKDAKNNGGIYDYKIKCDEGNNPPESIDRNELHVSIGIKPVKTAEFILIDFIALSTGGSWEEAGF